MADSYPYTLSNGRLQDTFEKLRTAAKPEKVTQAFLAKLGLVSSNDRAVIPLLKKLGFLTEEGSPTEYYDRLKDPSDQPFVLGERIKALYVDVFSVNTSLERASEDEMKGAFARVTGKDADSVVRYVNTFRTLVSLAKFGQSPSVTPSPHKEEVKVEQKGKSSDKIVEADFHYNIQIHLPATNDISVYNAIFKSIKENLL